MACDPTGRNAPKLPEAFGPIRRYLSDGRNDHKRGWEEHEAREGGGHLPAVRPHRVVPRASLAERFRERMAEGKRVKP
jgi:hypothetical protein